MPETTKTLVKAVETSINSDQRLFGPLTKTLYIYTQCIEMQLQHFRTHLIVLKTYEYWQAPLLSHHIDFQDLSTKREK